MHVCSMCMQGTYAGMHACMYEIGMCLYVRLYMYAYILASFLCVCSYVRVSVCMCLYLVGVCMYAGAYMFVVYIESVI
jgi:hypothetical protein